MQELPADPPYTEFTVSGLGTSPGGSGLFSRVFSLNPATKTTILANVTGKNDAARVKNYLEAGGVSFTDVPGATVQFDAANSTLLVTQTGRNLARIHQMLDRGAEPGKISLEIKVVDASPEDLRAIDPEKFRTQPAKSRLAGERISSGDMIMGEFDLNGMVRALAQYSGGRVLEPPSRMGSSWSEFTFVAWQQLDNREANEDGPAGRSVGKGSYTSQTIGVEIEGTAMLEENNRTILLNYSTKLTNLAGWLLYSAYDGVRRNAAGPATFEPVILPLYYEGRVMTRLAVGDGTTIITTAPGRDKTSSIPAVGAGVGTAPRFISWDAAHQWPSRGLVIFTTFRVLPSDQASGSTTGASKATALREPATMPAKEADGPVRPVASTELASQSFALPQVAREMMLDFGRPDTDDPFGSEPPVTMLAAVMPPIDPGSNPRAFFKSHGVDFDQVSGSTIAFTSDGIRVTQTPANLEKIRKIVAQVSSRTNIGIEARFLEMSAEEFAALDLGKYRLDGAKPDAVTIPTGVWQGRELPSIQPMAGRFDVPALVHALTVKPGMATLMATPDEIVLSGSEADTTFGLWLRYPQSYGVAGDSPKIRTDPPVLPTGTPQWFTVRNLGTEIRVVPTVDDDGHTILLHFPGNGPRMTLLADGSKVGEGNLAIGVGGRNPVWPNGGIPIFEAGWPSVSDCAVPDGGTAVFALPPTKEEHVLVPGRGMQPVDRIAPERRMLVLISAHIIDGAGR